MRNLLGSIKKLFLTPSHWKKAITILVIVTLLIMPQQAQALDFTYAAAGAVVGGLTCLIPAIGWLACGIGAALGAISGFALGADLFSSIIRGIIAFIIFLSDWVVTTLVTWAGILLQAGIELNTQQVIDPDNIVSQVVINTAAISRLIANLLLIAILIVIAMATITGLGGESYNVRRTLPLLIGMILLVNFSTVILGLVVDSGNVLMRFFWENSNLKTTDLSAYIIRNMEISDSQLASASTLTNVINNSNNSIEAVLAQGASRLMVLLLGLLAAYVFLRLAIVFFMRIGVFWILIMIAPIVFILGIIPQGRGYLKDWFKQLINWSFIGPVTLFFVFFGLIIWSQLNLQFHADVDGKGTTPASLLIIFPIIALFFIYALNISKKMAGAAANAVVDSVISIGKGIALGGTALAGGAAIAGVGGAALRGFTVPGKIPFIGGKRFDPKAAGQALQRAGFRKSGGRLVAAHEAEVKKTGQEIRETEKAYGDFVKDNGNEPGLLAKEYARAKNPRNKLAFIRAMNEEGNKLSPEMQADALKYGKSFDPDVRKKVKELYPAADEEIYKDGKIKDHGKLFSNIRETKEAGKIHFEDITGTDTEEYVDNTNLAFLMIATQLDGGDKHRIAASPGIFNKYSKYIGTVDGLSQGNKDQLFRVASKHTGFSEDYLKKTFDALKEWNKNAAQRRSRQRRDGNNEDNTTPNPAPA